LKDDGIQTLETTPVSLGVKRARPEEILGATPEKNAEISFKILFGDDTSNDPQKDIVLVNAAAAIIVGGRADDFIEAIELARESIDSGNAYERLKLLIKTTDGDQSALERLEYQFG
jgi:anthranilate phosphoribosyltransferase